MTLIGSVGAPTRLPPAADIGFLLAVAIVTGCGHWSILTSRTSIDGQHIAQTGFGMRRSPLSTSPRSSW
ncbi:hypothetical protein FSC37_15785 [Piscinibacter aquaticus]|uniref:Uncharacterized protein n=1 Tax=Piscinibacter aquaticus TaxID=392597 RepID=A0A5C6U3Y9_9BURK|nr:hypothetical protein FSC37_15785 [Piscinibacter aquaticus]